jgi:hypothetical protein
VKPPPDPLAPADDPPPLRGLARSAALAWLVALTLLHLAVRELGLSLLR